MTKFFTVLALGLLTLNVYAPSVFAGEERTHTKKEVVMEKKDCPEGEKWNEEKKLCEKEAKTK